MHLYAVLIRLYSVTEREGATSPRAHGYGAPLAQWNSTSLGAEQRLDVGPGDGDAEVQVYVHNCSGLGIR